MKTKVKTKTISTKLNSHDLRILNLTFAIAWKNSKGVCDKNKTAMIELYERFLKLKEELFFRS